MNELLTVSIKQAVNLIATLGDKQTFILEGYMGSGKSHTLKTLAKMFPDHHACFFDCTTKVDQGDMVMPNLMRLEGDNTFVRFVPHEELGLHTDKPLLIMIDEYGKNEALIRAVTSLMYERKLGALPLPEGSIVYATTNIAEENVGDNIEFHQWNRCTKLRMRKSTADEWISWALENDIHRSVMGFVKERPQVLQTFDTARDPQENQYIMHPGAPERKHFVTGRTLELASNLIHVFDSGKIDRQTLEASLAGTIGPVAAADLLTFIDLSGKAPRMHEIREDPEGTMVPEEPAIICLLIYNALGAVEDSWVSEWLKYMLRLPHEAQAMFVNTVIDTDLTPDSRQKVFWTNKDFVKWISENRHIYATADA